MSHTYPGFQGLFLRVFQLGLGFSIVVSCSLHQPLAEAAQPDANKGKNLWFPGYSVSHTVLV